MAFLPRKDREELKYIYLENVLQDVNREFIALNEDEKKRNNIILNQVLKQIIENMKKNSKLFERMFRKEFYGGSYFDNLKVGKPDEYDLDLLLNLPKYAEPKLEPASNIPGFVNIRLENVTRFLEQQYSKEFPDFARKLLDDHHYLSTSKVLSWIESTLTKAVNEFTPLSAKSSYVKQIDTCYGTFYFSVYKNGPAFTLKLKGKVNHEDVEMDIDLVPCFVFTNQKWPRSPYRQNPTQSKSEFFVVPKQPASGGPRYWRLSFQEQEGALINDSQNLKPALRLLKKLRDSCGHPDIASYYLKTMFLWEVVENKNIWTKPLSYVFMMMLKKYQYYIENGFIPYFWNLENNLLERVSPSRVINMAQRLRRIINEVEQNPHDPKCITWHLTRFIPEAAVYDFWSQIEDLPGNKGPGNKGPENKHQDSSSCTLF